jgi:cysteinyl-tRNA synthetase
MIEFTEGALAEAATGYQRLESFVRRAAERVGADAGKPVLADAFSAAMDDDLATPAAIAAVHEAVTAGNTALAADDEAAVAAALGSVRAMLGVLGLDPLDPHWTSAGGDQRLAAATDGLVQLALEQRAAARARKDYAAADAIRDQLGALGVQVEDTPQGTRWELTT